MSLLTRSRTESGEDPLGTDPALTTATAPIQQQQQQQPQSQDQSEAAVVGLESFHSTEDLKFNSSTTTLYCLDVHLKVVIEEVECEIENSFCPTGRS